ncbi:MAG TPA: sugar phosphate nucleotidyltransferase [Candidatus Saccharimonadales bacterium]|nr:sugar phosphate nucleotidyltransferase [Candidatus Saccharimonadales bacterium]
MRSSLSLDEFRAAHKEGGADVTAAVIPPKEYGLYVRDQNGRAEGYTKQDDPFAMSTIGIYMIRNKYLLDWARRIRQGGEEKPINITYDLVEPHILSTRAATFKLPEGSYWDDAGTHDRYHANNMRLSNGENVVDAKAYIDPDATINRCVVLGSVVLDAGVEFADAIISQQHDGMKITQM